MRKSHFTKAQIVGMIKDQEARMPTIEMFCKDGLNQGTFYMFKSMCGGMEVPDAAELKVLEDENAKLKRLWADTMLSNVVLKDRLGTIWRHQANGRMQRFQKCGITTSRNIGPARSLVSVPKPSGPTVRLPTQRYAKR